MNNNFSVDELKVFLRSLDSLFYPLLVVSMLLIPMAIVCLGESFTSANSNVIARSIVFSVIVLVYYFLFLLLVGIVFYSSSSGSIKPLFIIYTLVTTVLFLLTWFAPGARTTMHMIVSIIASNIFSRKLLGMGPIVYKIYTGIIMWSFLVGLAGLLARRSRVVSLSLINYSFSSILLLLLFALIAYYWVKYELWVLLAIGYYLLFTIITFYIVQATSYILRGKTIKRKEACTYALPFIGGLAVRLPYGTLYGGLLYFGSIFFTLIIVFTMNLLKAYEDYGTILQKVLDGMYSMLYYSTIALLFCFILYVVIVFGYTWIYYNKLLRIIFKKFAGPELEGLLEPIRLHEPDRLITDEYCIAIEDIRQKITKLLSSRLRSVKDFYLVFLSTLAGLATGSELQQYAFNYITIIPKMIVYALLILSISPSNTLPIYFITTLTIHSYTLEPLLVYRFAKNVAKRIGLLNKKHRYLNHPKCHELYEYLKKTKTYNRQ